MSKPTSKTDKGKKNLSYYFRFDLHTIQGSLTSGFMSLAVLSALLVVLSNWYWNTIFSNYMNSIKTVQPCINLVYQLGTHISNQATNIELSIVHKNTSYQLQADQDWQDQVVPALDTLNRIAVGWNTDENFVHLEMLNKEIENFRQASQNIKQAYKSINENAEAQANIQMLVLQQVLPLQQKIKQISARLNKNLMREQDKVEENVLKRRSYLPLVMISSFVGTFLLAFSLGTYIVSRVLSRIRRIKNIVRILSQGDIPEPMRNSQDEMNSIIVSVNLLSANLKQITHFAAEVGKGTFESDIRVFDNQGDLGQSLAAMRESLVQVSIGEQYRAAFNENYAGFIELMRQNNQNIDNLAAAVISRLCKVCQAVQASLYLVGQDDEQEPVLVLKSCYAFEKHKTIEHIIQKGQGLAGQVWLEKQIVLLTQVPNNYVNISSGLGGQNPQNIIVVPLVSEGQVQGVLEMAFFKEITEWDKNFIAKASESLAATINATITAQQTQKLLAESRQLTNQLRMQEESIRQQMEELQATQENTNRSYNQNY